MFKPIALIALTLCVVQAGQIKPILKALPADLETSESRQYAQRTFFNSSFSTFLCLESTIQSFKQLIN